MKIIITCIYILTIISCSSSKKLSYEKLMEGSPNWARQTPNSSEFYHGVGVASKLTNTDDFREIARRNALSDIASGISVNISSTSILNQFQLNEKNSSFYRDNIKLTTQQYLEGYELIDIWENEQQYWVYYHLSKTKFNQIKQQRINKAMEASKSEFVKARDFKDEGNFMEAMRFYIKSLDDIKDFFGDELKTEVNGEPEDYSSLLISEIIRITQLLEIVIPKEKHSFKRGVGHENETITLKVLYDNKNPVMGLTINSEFSYAPGKSIQKVSDANGNVRLKLDNFDTHKKVEYVSIYANINNLIRESTNDQIVIRLLESIEFPVYVITIEIITPKFYIDATESIFGDNQKNGRVISGLRSLLERDGFEIVNDSRHADYILQLDVSTQKGNMVNNKYTSILSASLKLKNTEGQIIYSKDVQNLMGLGSTFNAAGDDAYQSLVGKIKINIYPAMYSEVFQSF